MNGILLDYIRSHRENFIEDLRRLLRQPSISAQGKGIQECAKMVKEMMEHSGIETQILRLEGANPYLYGSVNASADKPTILFYGHYDVQPPEPLHLWSVEPFQAAVKGGKIVARGTSDSKANLMSLIKGTESYIKSGADLPVNLKFIIEGEEEISSPNLPRIAKTHKELLKADASVCFDGGLDDSWRPAVNLGVKGLLYVELRAAGAGSDLHSSRAPIVPNPAWKLVWALGTIKDEDEKILVEGWYNEVARPDKDELALLEDIPFNDDLLLKQYGLKSFLSGLSGSSALKRLVYEPTCTICGFESGYTGSGSKTVLPSSAKVKIDFRLVWNQDPEKQFKRLRRHLDRRGFKDIDLKMLGKLEPSKTSFRSPIAQAVINAAQETYGSAPVVYPNFPASGPDYVFTKILGLNSVWTGCSPPFANIHAPNEFITVERFITGVRYVANIIASFPSHLRR